jgi:hypothetical protein
LVLGCLLDTAFILHERFPTIFSTNQYLWIVCQGWLRSKLTKMVSVQPILHPCDLLFYSTQTESGIKIESHAVAAKSFGCNFYIFPDGEFNNVKDVYANALAREIDHAIISKLYKYNPCKIEDILNVTAVNEGPLEFDYIVGPMNSIEILQTRKACEKINLVAIPTILDPESYCVMSVAGKYPLSIFEKPIFAPYVILHCGPTTPSGTMIAMMRYGWSADKE